MFENSHKAGFLFAAKRTFSLHACAKCSQLPSDISPMIFTNLKKRRIFSTDNVVDHCSTTFCCAYFFYFLNFFRHHIKNYLIFKSTPSFPPPMPSLWWNLKNILYVQEALSKCILCAYYEYWITLLGHMETI